jgi:hypothetical protein
MEVPMRSRLLALLSVPALLIALLFLASVPFPAQQVKQSPAKKYVPPRLADGHPDLQGVWNNATITPMQRPKEFADKPVLTEEEAAKYTKEELDRVNADRRDGGGNADIGRAYNEFWRDRGKVTPDRRTSLIVDPPDGRIPPLTSTAQARAKERAARNKGKQFDGPENRGLAERCISVRNAGPPMEPTNYNANYQIVQAPGYVALLSEQIHDVRVIPTDGRPHIPKQIWQYLGDSRGRWEGDTLVVETTNFEDNHLNGSGPNMKLTERFTRTGPETLMYEFTVEDPENYTKPWTARIPMNRTSDMIFEYACHEGNYGLEGSLAGARAEEKAAAAAKKGSQ